MALRLLLNIVLETTLCISVSSSRVTDFQQCDRECRYHLGVDAIYGNFTNKTAFYDRDIVGKKVKLNGYTLSFFGEEYCRCNQCNEQNDCIISRKSTKKFDTKTFWCGKFDSELVCSKGGITTSIKEAQQRGFSILHCGSCAACSNEHDLEVLWRTRTNITTLITKCVTSFVWHQDVEKLVQCLIDKGINFSTESVIGPSCMQCWTDNIMCDAVNCRWNLDCIKKFFSAKNTGDFAGCLECDEINCGAEFIRCAGANRRSTGIMSDIERGDRQICKIGYYYDHSMSANVSYESYNVSNDAKDVHVIMTVFVIMSVLVVFIGIVVLVLCVKMKKSMDNLNNDYALLENDQL